MTIEEKNIELKEKFVSILEDVKGKINKDIVDNEKFDEIFIGELNHIYFKTAKSEFDIDIALDKNYVSIISNEPLVNCAKSEFDGNNKNFFKTTFYSKNGNLFVEYDQGTLLDKSELEKNDLKASMAYESKLETNYSMRCFTKDGIEYSNNSYKDSYLLDSAYDATNLREVVLSSFHKPVFSEYKFAKAPIHLLNASVRNTYRKAGEFAVIHTNSARCTKTGYEDIKCLLYSSHPMFPDLLRGSSRIAISTGDNGDYIFSVEKEYAESLDAGLEKANREFKEAIEKDKDKINERVYKNLIENLK